MPNTYGSFDLNGNTPTGGYLLRSKNLDFAEVKPILSKIAHLDGMKQNGSAVNERTIQVLVDVIGTSRNDLESKLDALDAALRLQQQQLKLHSLDSRYFLADCISAPTTIGDSLLKASVAITFLCANPYAYAASASTQTINAATLSNVSGNIYKYADQTFAGGGSAVALPTIRLTKTGGTAWTQVTVNQTTDSRLLTITSNLPSANSDFIDIYCDPFLIPSGGFSVQKNSATACAFNGIFPVLQPTNTSWTIQVTVASGTPQGSALWTWNARWMR